jgi:hypothetical protein
VATARSPLDPNYLTQDTSRRPGVLCGCGPVASHPQGTGHADRSPAVQVQVMHTLSEPLVNESEAGPSYTVPVTRTP